MRYTVRPISDRTAFTGHHENSRFTVTWSGALQVLERELDFLAARELVFEVDVPESGIRLDGQLRADARAASPAVRIAFESKHGPLTYATDRFVRPSWRREGMQQDWQHNVYAIAASLEALRKVDRYGVTKRGEQYAGWKQLPSGSGAAPMGGMTRSDADELLWQISQLSRDHVWPVGARWKKARARAHPDRNDGDRTLWDQVEQAATVLGLS